VIMLLGALLSSNSTEDNKQSNCWRLTQKN
jgi:hypothetical protein